MLNFQGNVDIVLLSITESPFQIGRRFFWKADNSSPVESAKGFVVSNSHNKERKMEEQRSSNFMRFCILENQFDERIPERSLTPGV